MKWSSLNLINTQSIKEKPPKGFTLIECLILLALISIIGFMSALLFTSLTNKSNLKLAIESIINGIEFTQMSAIAHRQSAVFCGSQNHMICDNHWNDGQLTRLANHQILRHYPALPTDYQLIWKSSLGKNSGVQFTQEGGTAGQQGSFYLCKEKSNRCHARIILLQTGRIRIEYFKTPTSMTNHAPLDSALREL